MHRRLLAASLAVAAAGTLIGSSGALADASQTITPGPGQKAAIVRAWARPGTYRGPSRCLTVKISRNSRWLAGVAFNRTARGCTAQAFDGTAILYGTGNAWYQLTAGSSVPAAQCSALKLLMGANGWQDLADFAAGLGCQNVD